MNILTNIKAYIYNALLLLPNAEMQEQFNTNVVANIKVLEEEAATKTYIKKLQKKLIANLNSFIRKNTLSRKEKAYLKDVRNYLLQIKNLLSEQPSDIVPATLLSNMINEEFKQKLQTIAENSETKKGKLTKKTGEVIEFEVKTKKADLNLYDKNYVFSYTIKKK